MRTIDRLRSIDPTILWITVGLVCFGLIMLWSATGPIGVARTGSSLFFVKRQLLNGILPGFLLFFFFAWTEYDAWRPIAVLGLIASFIGLVMVFIPGIGLTLGGARGWIQVAGMSLQPSEFVKFGFLLYLAAWLANREDHQERHTWENGLAPFLGALGTIVLLIVLQPDTGSMAVIVSMALFMYFVSGAPLRWFFGLSAFGAGLLSFLVRHSQYRAVRFMSFLHPEIDPLGVGYHINQAMLAIGSGGWFGLGYGHSRQKFLYLPEVEADSISAVIGEEMGFIVTVLLLLVFFLFVFRCFQIARETRDPFGRYIATGVGAWVATQLFLNVGSMTGLVPMTGVTLPFVSHGGSAMVALLAATGCVAGIPRYAKKTR